MPMGDATRGLIDKANTISLKRYTQAGVTIALVGSAAFGGLKAVEPPELPRIEPHERHNGPQLATTIERVIVVDELRPIPDPEDGHRILAVVATIENLSDETITGGLADAIVLADVPAIDTGEVAPHVGLIRDTTTHPHMHPGLPDRLVFSWTVPAEDSPDTVTVVVRDKTLVPNPMTLHGPTWLHPEPAALVEVDVEDLDKASTP